MRFLSLFSLQLYNIYLFIRRFMYPYNIRRLEYVSLPDRKEVEISTESEMSGSRVPVWWYMKFQILATFQAHVIIVLRKWVKGVEEEESEPQQIMQGLCSGESLLIVLCFNTQSTKFEWKRAFLYRSQTWKSHKRVLHRKKKVNF